MSPSLARKWAEMLHLHFIDALSESAPLSLDRISFHGGTNLHLSWGSPRHSEDLDFLVRRDFGRRIVEIMPRVRKRMTALAAAIDPDLQIELRDRTRDPDGLLDFRISVSSPNIVGKVMVKAEFWQVEDDYLAGYGSRFTQPQGRDAFVSRVSQPVPAATLDSAFADKVVALAYRPFLKWRDLFDLWWISKQQPETGHVDRLPGILHNATAYRDGNSEGLADGLRAFLARDPEAVLAEADPDLKRWLPKALWDAMYPDGVRDMVTHAREVAQAVLERLESAPAETPRGSSADDTAVDARPGETGATRKDQDDDPAFGP